MPVRLAPPRHWQLLGLPLLDPTNLPATALESPLGFTAQTINYTSIAPLLLTRSIYARGIGRLSRTSTLLTGSSGGFTDGQTLIEASVAGKLYRLNPVTAPSLQLELATQFRNCALPCYYAACGFGSPVDPPNTNKPCLEARLAIQNFEPGSNLLITLTSESGQTAFTQSIPLAPGQAPLYRSIPFYRQTSTGAPVTLLPAGDYFVSLSALSPEGKLLATTAQKAMLKGPF